MCESRILSETIQSLSVFTELRRKGLVGMSGMVLFSYLQSVG